MNGKLPWGVLDALWADDSHWRAGVIYSCKEDRRLVDPKRYWSWGGWTMNFAHASARLLLMAIIVVATIPPWFWRPLKCGASGFGWRTSSDLRRVCAS